MSRKRTNIVEGQIFGNWQVLESFRRDGISYVKCQCSCSAQTIKDVRRSNLTSGKSQSCGCQSKKLQRSSVLKNNKETKTSQLSKGTTWGYLTILEDHTSGDYLKAECICGVVKEFIKFKILQGKSRSCGCMSSELNKQTNLQKYQVEYSCLSEQSKEKRRQTSLERYGVEHPIASQQVRSKIEKTNIARFGDPIPVRTPEVRQKIEQTCLEKYGSRSGFGSEEVRQKAKETLIKRYGVEYPIQSPTIHEKIRSTCLEKFGTLHYIQSVECAKQNLIKFGVEYPLSLWKKEYGTPSKNEAIIAEMLAAANIPFEVEYQFEDCRNVLPLSFDFYLPTHNMLIEYDGEQHYRAACFGGISKERAEDQLIKIQKRDQIKTKYAKDNQILLVRIKYTESVERRMKAIIKVLNSQTNQKEKTNG